DDPRVSEVAAGLTVTATAAESLLAKPLAPKKVAVSAWVPMPSDTGIVAWPVASSGAEPSSVSPSRKKTVPIGVLIGVVTVGVGVRRRRAAAARAAALWAAWGRSPRLAGVRLSGPTARGGARDAAAPPPPGAPGRRLPPRGREGFGPACDKSDDREHGDGRPS